MAETSHNAEVENLSWYHYSINRHAAEGLLMANGKDGSYLLRASTSSPGDYALSVKFANSVIHFLIRWDGSQYKFGMGTFSCLSELLEDFENKPLIGGDSGVLILFKYPYPRDIAEPSTYEKVRVHAEWGKTRKSSVECCDDGVQSFGSKEGYLTKLGGKIKNWKTRWFVLLKNELKYFKAKGDKEPIKTINLEECQEVARDESLGKGNCFRIVMPYRTFFCYANSTQEAEEWIKILQWTLKSFQDLQELGRQLSEKKRVLGGIPSSSGVGEEELVKEAKNDVKAVSVQATEVESQGVIAEELSGDAEVSSMQAEEDEIEPEDVEYQGDIEEESDEVREEESEGGANKKGFLVFRKLVTSEGAHWAAPLGAVHLMFPPNAVSEPTSVEVHRWKYSVRSPPLQEHEAITSNVIELSSMDGQHLKFNTKVKLSLSHSATDLRGYELVIKRLIDEETNKWEDVDGTRDIRCLQEIKDHHPSHMEIPNSFFPIAQTDITECSTYAVVCRLKSSPTYTITSNGGSFSHPDFSGITVTIPENAVGPDAKFPVALKVQQVPSDDFKEKGVLLGPILRIHCFEVLHFLRSVTIQLPISLEDQQLLNSDPAPSWVRVLFLKSDGKKKEWIEITDDLVTPLSFDGKFVRFQVERFSGYTCWVHSRENRIDGLGITRYYNSLVYDQPRQVVFVAGFRPRNFNILCLVCCLTHLKEWAKENLKKEEGKGIKPVCADSIEDMIPGRGWASVSVSGGIRLFDERDAGNVYLRLYEDDKPPFKTTVEIRWVNDQVNDQNMYTARVEIRTLKPTWEKSTLYTNLFLEKPTNLEERARRPRTVKKGNPTDDELEDLSEKVSDKWKKLGRRLNFGEAKLVEFGRNEELEEKAYTMLMAWKRRYASDATYRVLYEALRHKHVGRSDLAEEFCCY